MPTPTRFGLSALAVTASAVALAITSPGTGAAAGASQGRHGLAIKAAEAHLARTHFGAAQKFTVRSQTTDPDGTTHVRLDRTYHGLPVVGGDIVVHQSKGGAWEGADLTLDHALTLDPDPVLSAHTASGDAMRHLDRGIRGA
ncbi:MAG TPA: hypothetical protein VF426_11660, partial [Marmoricola sp.]